MEVKWIAISFAAIWVAIAISHGYSSSSKLDCIAAVASKSSVQEAKEICK